MTHILCRLGIHRFHDTFRDVLTFDENNHVIGAKAPTVRCKRCGKPKDIAADYQQAWKASVKTSPYLLLDAAARSSVDHTEGK